MGSDGRYTAPREDLWVGERGEAMFINVDFGDGVALAANLDAKGDQMTLLLQTLAALTKICSTA